MKTNLEVLKEVAIELKRFNEKFIEAIEFENARKSTYDYPSKKMASCKRAALDLKMELTKITQLSKYKYEK